MYHAGAKVGLAAGDVCLLESFVFFFAYVNFAEVSLNVALSRLLKDLTFFNSLNALCLKSNLIVDSSLDKSTVLSHSVISTNAHFRPL